MRRRNPQPTDYKGRPLREHQVREILSYYDKIEQGGWPKSWFENLLRMPGADKQVARHILNTVNWYINGAKVNRHSGLMQYLDELDVERYPDVGLDLEQVRELVKSKNKLPEELHYDIENLRSIVISINLAEREGVSRQEMHGLLTRAQNLFDQINFALAPEEEEASEEGDEETGPIEFADCNICGDATFDWLEPEERKDLVEISSKPEIATLQHQLRHMVLDLYAATQAKRQRMYIMNLEDDIEYTHAKIERLRKNTRRNPDSSLRQAERNYRAEPSWENFSNLQTERIRAGLQQHYHDCDQCIPLGSEQRYDFYFCPEGSIASGTGGSLLARYDSDGPDYSSMSVDIILSLEGQLDDRPLGRALQLAREQGHL